MRIVSRYLISSFLATFVGAMLVLTFILSIGTLFKITDLLARGVPWRPIVAIFLWAMPDAMSYAIPIGALVSSLLVFSRLSADSEITAMRACGLSLWRVVAPPVLVSLAMSALCLALNGYLSPRGHLARRTAIAQLGMQSPLELIEEGRWIDEFPGLNIWVGRRIKDRLYDVRIVDVRDPSLVREIKALSGVLRMAEGRDLILTMEKVVVDPADAKRRAPGTFEAMEVRVENAFRVREYKPREDDFTLGELVRRLRQASSPSVGTSSPDPIRWRTVLRVELNQRLVLAVSTTAFVFLGAGLGIRSHRRESSIGIAISLLVMFFFYLFMMVAKSLVHRPMWRPEWLIWTPVAGCLAIGWRVLRRHQ